MAMSGLITCPANFEIDKEQGWIHKSKLYLSILSILDKTWK